MLQSIIENISNSFISEAIASPDLLADMAAMEKYMAESYSGRVFIELLQNADDCSSTKIAIKEVNGSILFANNGRPFDEKDVQSICRSGSSNKEREKTIGYRGIGFKSTTYLTDEIIIYSDNTYFSFSKKACAQKLHIEPEKIPMIRIPLLVEDIDEELGNEIRELETDGYNSVFIFRNANITGFLEEIKGVEIGMFLFLHSIEECYIKMAQYTVRFSLQRQSVHGGTKVVNNSLPNNAWYIVRQQNTAIGLKFDLEKQRVIACSESEQLYHSYLPTFDKTPFPFKINADFSTDPSRKHIVFDSNTERAIVNIAENIVGLIERALNENDDSDLLTNLFTILNKNGDFSQCNSVLRQKIKELLADGVKLMLRNGNYISISQYRLLPSWLDESEKRFLRAESYSIGQESLSETVYRRYADIDSFLIGYSSKSFSTEDLIHAMDEETLISKMPYSMQGKMLGTILRAARFEKPSPKITEELKKIKIATNEGIKSVKQIESYDYKVEHEVKEVLSTIAGASDLGAISKNTNVDFQKVIGLPTMGKEPIVKSAPKRIQPRITKWRSAEQQCLEIELYFGNVAEDVSKKNIGYDIESTTPNGDRRHIEVKLVGSDGSFSMTNNEYTAAYQFGDQYYLCLLLHQNCGVQVMYIQNPVKNVSLEKRVKQWEWYC